MTHAKAPRRGGRAGLRSRCASASLRAIIALVGAMGVTSAATAADVAVDTVLGELERPNAIAVRPGGSDGRHELFIAESGAGRVVRWSSRTPDEIHPAIDGWQAATELSGPASSGPLALWFIDPNLLVVAGAAPPLRDAAPPLRDGAFQSDGCLAVFDLSSASRTLSVDDAIDRRGGSFASATTDDPLVAYALTRTRANEHVPDMLILAIRNGRGDGGLVSSRVQAGMVGPLRAYGTAGPLAGRPPLAVATSNTRRIVVVTREGPSDAASACRLVFFHPTTGSVELAMPLELADVRGLAYSPVTGRLYAAEFGGDAERGGIYRIDDASEPGRPACEVVQIADMARPTALAFGPDGSLYVTTYDRADERGTLQLVTGGL